jgi:translation initiation factor 2B subunit (eIF-2B alpha/beta/delta family)
MGASVLNVVLSGLEIIEGNLSSSCPLNKSTIDEIVRALSKYACDRKTTSSRTNTTFQAFLEIFSGDGPLKILTLSSRSTTTLAIAHVLRNTLRPIEVHVIESRPLFEGVKIAEVIASSAGESKALASLTVCTDASVGVAAQGVDIVLMGANIISSTAAVSNKVGSLPAVLTAKYVAPGVEVVILSEKEKLLPFLPPDQEENNPQEVIQAWVELSSSLKESPHYQCQKRVLRMGVIRLD